MLKSKGVNSGNNSRQDEDSGNDFDSFDLTTDIEKNIDILKGIFRNDETIKFRRFKLDYKGPVKCCLVFSIFMVKSHRINDSILRPLMSHSPESGIRIKNLPDYIMENILIENDIIKIYKDENIIDSIMGGSTILLIDGVTEVLSFDTIGFVTRDITEPESEAVVRGPREGFVEALAINISLIRRRIKTPGLKFIFREIGLRTKTEVCICYIEAIASKKILKELLKRLDNIDIDGILDTGYIEELIRDSPLTPFETVGNTERPDVAAGKLLEGRIVIMCEGSPFALTVPFLFLEYFQASEDYYENFVFASINRVVRSIGFFLTTSTPAIYVALTTYHKELLPTPLIISISASREGVPLPTIIEAILMLMVFEVLREAGTRLPKTIGQTISIVGALVLGDAAVNAKLVSAPMIIVVAITAISAFMLVKMKAGVIIIRATFLILAATLGLYGYIFGVIGLFIHLMSLRSFGVPYMLDIAPINEKDINDTVVRAPWWLSYYRPALISNKNRMRMGVQKNKGR